MGLMKELAQQELHRRYMWEQVKTRADRELAVMRARDDARGMSPSRIRARDKRRKKKRASNFSRWA